MKAKEALQAKEAERADPTRREEGEIESIYFYKMNILRKTALADVDSEMWEQKNSNFSFIFFRLNFTLYFLLF